MRDPPIYITDDDLRRLRRLLQAPGILEGRDTHYLEDLLRELNRAVVVPASEIPFYVITMRSRFHLKDLDTGQVSAYTLVFPDEAPLFRGYLSVLAPMGTALLGQKELDTVTWHVPAGRKRVRVERVLYQPEAAAGYETYLARYAL